MIYEKKYILIHRLISGILLFLGILIPVIVALVDLLVFAFMLYIFTIYEIDLTMDNMWQFLGVKSYIDGRNDEMSSVRGYNVSGVLSFAYYENVEIIVLYTLTGKNSGKVIF